MYEDILERVLITEDELKLRVKELGDKITNDYKGKCPLLVGILKGSVIFFSDLVRQINTDVEMDFMSISSYGSGTKSSGEVKVIKDLDRTIEGKDVIIVEDIIDSGYTMSYLIKMLSARNPASIKIATLLDKPERRETNVESNYCGFVIENEFVVGYGLDYAGKYRNLPLVGVLKPEVYQK